MKHRFSSKAKFVILSFLFLVIALIGLLVGFTIAGADVIAWFSSKYAMIVYFFIFFYGAFAVGVFVKDWIRNG